MAREERSPERVNVWAFSGTGGPGLSGPTPKGGGRKTFGGGERFSQVK